MIETPQIGPRIKQLRKEQKLTLNALSEKSQVSPSILSELERSKGNPTFATLWSVAKALGVNLSDLTDGAKDATSETLEVIQPHFTPVITSKDEKTTLKILGPSHLIGVFEWYEIAIEPQGRLVSEAHKAGTWEHLTCSAGQFEVCSGAVMARIEEGATVRYLADKPHEIKNNGDSIAIGILIVSAQ